MKGKPVILVVDDTAENAELMEAYLVPKGYEVIRVVSGDEALEKIRVCPIDLVLLDVMMPGMDGFEVTRRVRNDPSRRQLPIILVTALKEQDDRVKGIEAGCDDFISTPVDKNELMARVQSLLKAKDYNDLLGSYRAELESAVTQRTEELRVALEQVKASSLETIFRLSTAAEYKDEVTGAHLKRMSLISAAIARQLGLDAATVETILYAAPMHDVGKIGIPDLILVKPGKLDPLELEIMKQHTAIGARILKGSDAEFIRLAETIALTHHEKWDGSGYPNGLKGLAIPMAGRITAVADVFDALTSIRPYKEAFPVDQSLAMIKEGSGSSFDPAVVDAFLAVQDEIQGIMTSYSDENQKPFTMTEMSGAMLKVLMSQYNQRISDLLPES
jgi:putative two-component system response regulator